VINARWPPVAFQFIQRLDVMIAPVAPTGWPVQSRRHWVHFRRIKAERPFYARLARQMASLDRITFKGHSPLAVFARKRLDRWHRTICHHLGRHAPGYEHKPMIRARGVRASVPWAHPPSPSPTAAAPSLIRWHCLPSRFRLFGTRAQTASASIVVAFGASRQQTGTMSRSPAHQSARSDREIPSLNRARAARVWLFQRKGRPACRG